MMNDLNFSEENAFKAVENLIRCQGIPVTSKTIRESLYFHPAFPSMSVMSDVLTEWNIPNLASSISSVQLIDAPLPAIVYLERMGGYYAITRKACYEEGVVWLDMNRTVHKDSFSSFTQKWAGIILLIEPDQISGEAKYAKKEMMRYGRIYALPS